MRARESEGKGIPLRFFGIGMGSCKQCLQGACANRCGTELIPYCTHQVLGTAQGAIRRYEGCMGQSRARARRLAHALSPTTLQTPASLRGGAVRRLAQLEDGSYGC